MYIPKDIRKKQLKSALWLPTKSGYAKVMSQMNENLTQRAKHLVDGNPVELYGPLLTDLTRTGVFLPNGVEMLIVLRPARPQFYFMAETAEKALGHSLRIDSAELVVRKHTPLPEVLRGIEARLSHEPATIP